MGRLSRDWAAPQAVRWTGWILPAIYLIALALLGGEIGRNVAKHYRAKTTGCKPCELAASAPKPVAPGMGVSNP